MNPLKMLNIGWFSTGRGEGSRGLLKFVQDRITRGELDARIQFVFSNREPGEAEGSDEFFHLLRGCGLPLVTLSSAKFRSARGGSFAKCREEYDREVLGLLEGYRPDIGVLAGYMLIVSSVMCRKYSLLNLHPALPNGPTGTWQDVIWTLIEQRSLETGAMVHLVTEEVDRGPVVSYCTAPISGGEFAQHRQSLDGKDLLEARASQGEEFPLFQLIRQAEYRREPYLLFATLQAMAAGDVVLRGGEVLGRDGLPLKLASPRGLGLDAKIDQAMRANTGGAGRIAAQRGKEI